MTSGILSDFGLMYVAARLGAEWTLVVSHLGLKQAEIEQIQQDNPYKTINQTSIALQLWRDRQDGLADTTLLQQLFSALKSCDRTDLLEEIQEKYNMAGKVTPHFFKRKKEYISENNLQVYSKSLDTNTSTLYNVQKHMYQNQYQHSITMISNVAADV